MIEKEQQKSEIIAANKVIGIKLVESCNSVTNPSEWAANNDHWSRQTDLNHLWVMMLKNTKKKS